jgi:hypothetical protein
MSTKVIAPSIAAVARPPLTRAARENLLCVAAVVASIAVGVAVQLFLPPARVLVLGVTVGWMALVLLLSLIPRLGLRDSLGSFRFAGILLAVIAVAVVVGTVVPQGKAPEVYAERYGETAPALVALGITTIFHSAWFGTLLGVLAAGLVLSAVRRFPPTVRTFGFFLCHAGLLLILGGSAASFALAERGRVDLRVGAPPATTATLTESGVRTGEQADLGFAVRLDGFRVDRYASEYRLAVYELLPEGGAKRLAVLDDDLGVKHRLPDRASYRVKAHAVVTGAEHHISENGGPPREVQVGGELQLADGAVVRVVAFYPSFYFDLDTRTAGSAGDAPNNPALEVQVVAPGAEPRRQFLVMRAASGHGGRAGLTYAYRGGAPEGDPALVVEVTDERGTREAKLVASQQDAVLFGDRKVITFERTPEEARSYRSTISVIDAGGEERPLSVAVNAPASVNGWMLYQVNYDPRDPSYSGLEAVRDPGVPYVFAGFALVVLGVPYMVNVAPWLRRRQTKAQMKGDRS